MLLNEYGNKSPKIRSGKLESCSRYIFAKFKIRFINVWFSAMIPAKKSVRQEIMQLISKSIKYQDSSFPLSVNFHA